MTVQARPTGGHGLPWRARLATSWPRDRVVRPTSRGQHRTLQPRAQRGTNAWHPCRCACALTPRQSVLPAGCVPGIAVVRAVSLSRHSASRCRHAVQGHFVLLRVAMDSLQWDTEDGLYLEDHPGALQDLRRQFGSVRIGWVGAWCGHYSSALDCFNISLPCQCSFIQRKHLTSPWEPVSSRVSPTTQDLRYRTWASRLVSAPRRPPDHATALAPRRPQARSTTMVQAPGLLHIGGAAYFVWADAPNCGCTAHRHIHVVGHGL